MADEESSKLNPASTSSSNVTKVSTSESTSELEKLQLLTEDNLNDFQEQKNLQDASQAEGPQKYVPGPLPKVQASFSNIQQRLLSLIICSEEEEDETAIIYRRPEGIALEEIQKISFVSHSLAALVGTYDEYLVRKIALQIFSETTLWINRLFRFFDSMAYFHRDTKEGLLRVMRLVLHIRYPKYSTDGYEALYTRPPVIYYNGVSWPGLEQHLCSQLGLPISCITSIPTSSIPGSLCKIDPVILEKRILEDAAAAKIPLIVIAGAGSPLLGQVDDLMRLRELCQLHNIWLHVDGHALSTLGLEAAQDVPSDFADSMTLCLGKWVGIPDLSCVTLYMTQDASHVHASGLSQSSHTMLESTLPLWVTVQALGYANISKRIKHCLDLTSYLFSLIEKHPEFRLIGKDPTVSLKSNDNDTPEECNKKPVLFNDISTVIVFQYVQHSLSKNEQMNQYDMKNPLYFDNLNSWLVQLLARNIPTVKTDVLDLDNYGVCLRVCFLESAYLMGTDKKDIDYYYSCLQHQLSILNATVKQRELLYENHNKYRKLQLVQIKEWAGMGGVRYIPDVWADRLNELTDTGKEDINNLNSELVDKLKASDSAFSLGEADDGMLCVRFGMVDEDLDMNELIHHVIAVGQEMEDSSKFLETMAEMVKHGIEEANKELVQENQEKIMQEGLLKQVPVIGSLVSWWYPSQGETGIKGRSFDLSSGTIESTENIYKYHMQIKEGVPHTPPPATKVLISPGSLSTSPQPPPDNNQSQQNS